MRKKPILILSAALLLVSCSPRDFLTRRLAADLIALSDSFKAPQHFVLQTGIVSGKEYFSPEYLVLQHHGWISATNAPCAAGLTPPCWDILLTPSGVDTVRSLISSQEASKPAFAIPAAKRQMLEIVGITRQSGAADVDFTWKWVPLNEIGAALYSSDVHYRSTVGFRNYDDGWRVTAGPTHTSQTLDEALKNAEPEP
jgi:hypothetical protein